MGRKSVKKDKTIYQLKREELGLSREKAAELLYISEDRIYRIENDRVPSPEEVLTMAEKYKEPSLCNYYCANQCPIGKKHSVEVEVKDLTSAVIQTLASLDAIEDHKRRLIEIAADGVVSEAELPDFKEIQEALKKISVSVESLRLWAEKAELHD